MRLQQDSGAPRKGARGPAAGGPEPRRQPAGAARRPPAGGAPAGILFVMINVTPSAAEKITELLTEENKLDAGLRVFVQGGGCSGFQYGLMIEEGEAKTDADQTIESNGVRLFVDPISVRYLKGAEVDFVESLAGGGFTIRNPNAKSTCGCVSSFSA
jgi:iron-sulfur cluster assembly accessory protein